MPVTITFHKVSERVPKHGEHIIHLRPISSFDAYGFEPREITVEYQLDELDEDGEYTGTSAIYQEGDEPEPGYQLSILFERYHADPDDLWIPVEEYWNSF